MDDSRQNCKYNGHPPAVCFLIYGRLINWLCHRATYWTAVITLNHRNISFRCPEELHCTSNRALLGCRVAELDMLMGGIVGKYILSHCMSRKCKQAWAFRLLHFARLCLLSTVESMGEWCHLFSPLYKLQWGHCFFCSRKIGTSSRDGETCHLSPPTMLERVPRFSFGLYTLAQCSVDASFVGGT